jgi:heptosyltransferase-3
VSDSSILVIRRDNIGDLVCTLPFIHALRAAHPHAWLGVLANTYNAPVVAVHPDISEVLSYCKLKHRGDASLARVLWQRVELIRRLRAQRLDTVVLATPAYQPRTVRLARWLRPRRIVGFSADAGAPGLDIAVPLAAAEQRHEVERVMLLGAALGIEISFPPAHIIPDPRELESVRRALIDHRIDAGTALIGVHISARKPSQRWPAERFAALMRRLHEREGASFMLFWAPGAADNPLHPGDDDSADKVQAGLAGIPYLPWRTEMLPQLIGGLAACGRIICADGGAMHLAAALGKPIVCLFGQSDSVRWRPWGVPHELLQASSREVRDLSVESVLKAYDALTSKLSTTATAG